MSIEIKKIKHSISSNRRFRVLRRDGFRCKYCGRTESDGIKLEVDHIISKSAGGEDDMENLITACYDCNHGKTNVDLFNHINTTSNIQCKVLKFKVTHFQKFRGITIEILNELKDFNPRTTNNIAVAVNKPRNVTSVILDRLKKNLCVEKIGVWGWKITINGLLALDVHNGLSPSLKLPHSK